MSENLKALAYKLRIDTIDIIMAGGGGHISGKSPCRMGGLHTSKQKEVTL